MPNERFYKTAAWRELREQRLRFDQHRCIVPGCGARAVVVDHINSSERGRAVPIARLRSLCRLHDNQVKEDASGKRRSGGRLRVIGCDADGAPLDPGHWWRQ
jgi:hypothetical protein